MSTEVEPESHRAGAGPRHGWVWAALPADAARVYVQNDQELEALLRDAGVPDVHGLGDDLPEAADALVLGGHTDRGLDPAAIAEQLAPGGVCAVPLGDDGTFARGRRLARVGQVCGAAIRTGRLVRSWTGRLAGAGLRVSTIVTGQRSRVHRLRLRGGLPFPGAVVIGSRGKRRPTAVEHCIQAAARDLGDDLVPGRVEVRGSGTVLIRVRGARSGKGLLRVAAGSAARLNERSANNLRQLEAEAGEEVRSRLVRPRARGDAGLVSFTVEPLLAGSSPRAVGSGLADECLRFLVALRGARSGPGAAAKALASDSEALLPHLDAAERGTLQRLTSRLLGELSALPGGWVHGDFWPGNLVVRRGRLRAVIDWDAALRDGLPMLDLLHLTALGGNEVRRLPHGARCTRVLWPLARSGGDQRMRAYCEATATPATPAVLEALAQAYWLSRVGRDLRTFADRGGRRSWMRDNVHRPLAALEQGGEA